MKIWFHTFGCRVNQYETQALREKLLQDGSIATADMASADVCVVNTCTVTSEADNEVLRLMRRIVRKNPAARLVVTGCLAAREPKLIEDAAPGAIVVGNEGKNAIPEMLGCRTGAGFAQITSFGGRARAFVKIQDGCNMHCTFCIIPAVRPRLECKPIVELEKEVSGLVSRGFCEIVLCGIRLGRYLIEDEAGRRVDFIAMLERLLALPGNFRIRLSSLEITDVTDRFIALVARSAGRICPSLHLPLQSGSETVLKRMQRWYSAAFYERRVAAARAGIPGLGLFADIMAGFPGETRAEHEESLAFVRRMDYAGLHVFRYSRRSGTPAASLRAQVSDAEIERRAEEMRTLDRELRRRFAARSLGQRRTVVMENKGLDAIAEDFLTVRLPDRLAAGLHPVRIGSIDGSVAIVS